MDGVPAEVLKYGGQAARSILGEVVREMWRRALGSLGGNEAEDWPAEWTTGIVVPIWKKKGKKRQKYLAGITLLSEGTKVLARVVAERLLVWSDSWLQEPQSGFRHNRGVDDTLQVSRRLVCLTSKKPTPESVGRRSGKFFTGEGATMG